MKGLGPKLGRFLYLSPSVKIIKNLEVIPINTNNPVDEIRTKYIKNPPEGMTASDIKAMSDDDLLDMHYFLEDDDFNPEDEVGAEGFYIF